jgi:hypothetical protein
MDERVERVDLSRRHRADQIVVFAIGTRCGWRGAITCVVRRHR